MPYEKELVTHKLRRWDKYLARFKLPLWDDIPNLGLYMDQVIALLTEYLDYLPPDIKEERIITAAIINNYVRLKVIPAPTKKKYYRSHIAALIMICTLKQSLGIADMKSIVPFDLSVDDFKDTYNAYAERHRAAAVFFKEQVMGVAAKLLDPAESSDAADAQVMELIVSSAITGGFAQLLAEKLLQLDGRSLEQIPDSEKESY